MPEDASSRSSRPNHWSDPDMLEVGVTGINAVEERSMFSLWATPFRPALGRKRLNDHVCGGPINPHQQRGNCSRSGLACSAGYAFLRSVTGLQVWARPSAGQNSPHAVLLFNRTSQQAQIKIRWEDLGIYDPAEACDLWSHSNLGLFPQEHSTQVPAHGVVMLRVVPRSE